MAALKRAGLVLMAALVIALPGVAASAQTAIRLSLDGKFYGPSAPFFVAIDKGYFKAEGLDVTVEAAENVQDPITRVASGSFDMGLADLSSLIRFRDANPTSPVKAVFVVGNKPAFAVVSRKSRGVARPKDLEGKVLGAPQGDASFAQWRIFTQANGIDPAKVKVERIGVPVREPMLQNGQVDAVTGLSYLSYVNLKALGVPVDDLVLMLMGDHGVELYGNAIIVSGKFATEKPQAVNGFLRALVRALRETVRDPASAVQSVIKRDDTLRRAVELERLRMAIGHNFVTPEVTANGYGAVDADRLARAIEQMAQSAPLKNKAKAAEAFDPSFLPPAADRKAN
jgi:NitT/TauT family transport system substrate-binding protein